jgi:hypothetical protein
MKYSYPLEQKQIIEVPVTREEEKNDESNVNLKSLSL